jgi:CyaY protein
MTESEFHRAADAVYARLESLLEPHEALDVDREGGVLTIECPDGSKVVVSRQPPLAEIWVAARSGGFHYAWREGAWRDTRSDAELFGALGAILAAQAGVALDSR